MWRSFFYALGVGLMMLGGEALVFERATLNPEAKLPPFVQRIFTPNSAGPKFSQPGYDQYAFGGPQQVGRIPNAVGPNTNQISQPPLVTPNAGYSSQSRFGPSRFAGPASGGYGGGRIGFGQNSRSPNPQSGLGSTPAQLASVSTPIGAGFNNQRSVAGQTGARGPKKVIITKDWMPWSLFAVGAVVFLYTHTSRR